MDDRLSFVHEGGLPLVVGMACSQRVRCAEWFVSWN